VSPSSRGAFQPGHEQVDAAGFAAVDYAQLCDAETLVPLLVPGPAPARLLVAARIGPARLIDNMPL